MKTKVISIEIDKVIDYADKYLSHNSNLKELIACYNYDQKEISNLLTKESKLDLNGKKLVLYKSCFAEDYAVNAFIKMLDLCEDDYVLTDGEDPYYVEDISGDDINIVFCSGCKSFVAQHLETIKVDLDPFKFFKGKPLSASDSRKKKENLGYASDDRIITIISPETYEAVHAIHELESLLKAGYKMVIAAKDSGPFRMMEEIKRNGLTSLLRGDKNEPTTNLGNYDAVLLYTKGEVNDFLDISDIAIIGEDRNIAEPLRKRVPTIALPGQWRSNRTLYKISRDMGAILITHQRPYELLRKASSLLENPIEEEAIKQNIDKALSILDRYIYRIMKTAVIDEINRVAANQNNEDELDQITDSLFNRFIDSFFGD